MTRSGRRRGRPTLPRTGGTRSTSGISWVTSLRLPPVTVQASGIPVASTRRWCLEPFLALSTGLGPVSEPPFSPARDWSRRPPATTRSHRPPAARQAAARAAAPRRLPAATHPAAGSRSSRSRSRARAADAARRSRCSSTNKIPCSACPIIEPLPARIAKTPLALGSNGSTRSHNSSDTIHGATAIGTPPSLTTDADGVRRQGTGPFISIRSLSEILPPASHAQPARGTFPNAGASECGCGRGI